MSEVSAVPQGRTWVYLTAEKGPLMAALEARKPSFEAGHTLSPTRQERSGESYVLPFPTFY